MSGLPLCSAEKRLHMHSPPLCLPSLEALGVSAKPPNALDSRTDYHVPKIRYLPAVHRLSQDRVHRHLKAESCRYTISNVALPLH